MNSSRGSRSKPARSPSSRVSRRTSDPLPLEALTAVSAVDGRYRHVAEALAPYFSEYALIKNRIFVEIEYFIALADARAGLRRLSDIEKRILRAITSSLSVEDARIIKRIEREGLGGRPATNHDVKAVEYFLKDKLVGTSLEPVVEWMHFALTSEDINSIAHGSALRSALEDVIFNALREIESSLEDLAKKHAKTAMLARTHGQAASPTTFGKEMKVFVKRLQRQVDALKTSTVLVKLGGASGNYNAHAIAAKDIDWRAFAMKFVKSLNAENSGEKHFVRLVLNDTTTQIEPHDTYAELFDSLRRINTILIDLSQDMWRYISDGWVTQKPKEGEIGSSAMPHKVNPIDFENAEGNLGVANALFEHFSRKLPISRLQRDLSDSTVERVFGTAFSHTLIAYASLAKGLHKVSVNEAALSAALEAHPEVLSEAIQTVLRKENVAVPYEKLKALTRGRNVTLTDFAKFIDSLDVDARIKRKLKALRPGTYIGLADKIARG